MTQITRRHLLTLPAAAALARAATLEQIPLGVTTDEIDDDLLTAVRFLREFNLRHCEIRNIWGKYNTAQPLDKIREAKAILDEHQIKLAVLSTGFFKIPLPADTADGRATLDQQWKLLDGAMERARIFGTNKIRVFAFTYKGQVDSSHYPRIYELVDEAARRAKGFQLALENVGGSYVSTGAESARLLSAVKAPNLGLAWDPNNAGASGEKAFPDGYKLLDPKRIVHLHLRDYKHMPNGKVEWTAVGEGEFDNLGQLRALLRDGYKGSFTLETHYKSPQGKAHATRTSLTALLKVIEKV